MRGAASEGIFQVKNKKRNRLREKQKKKAKPKGENPLTAKKEWHARRFKKERGRRTRMVRVSHF